MRSHCRGINTEEQECVIFFKDSSINSYYYFTLILTARREVDLTINILQMRKLRLRDTERVT